MSGSGKYVFPGQRPEVYPFQSIFPGKGGKFKRIGALESACTMLNCKIIESTAGSKKLTREEECVSQPKLFSPSSLGLPVAIWEAWKEKLGRDTNYLSLVSALLLAMIKSKLWV